MKKLLLAILLLLAAAGTYFYLNLNSTAKRLIEEAGAAPIGTPVHVSTLSFSLPDMKASIGKLSIENPKPYGRAFLKTDTVDFKVGSVSQTLVVLDEVVVDGMTITYMTGSGGSNIESLRRGMRTGKADANAAPAPKLIIKRLRITHAKLVPHLPGLGDSAVDIPDITMTNIGTKSKPATAAEVVAQIAPKIMNGAAAAARKVTLQLPEKAVRDTLGKTGGALKKLFK
ncbi:MAG TPA: hypothetical protein VEF76_05610 [Patescibacteria group bacterium]|nr:hypothetical protein [Patescibacteria group bacterium]